MTNGRENCSNWRNNSPSVSILVTQATAVLTLRSVVAVLTASLYVTHISGFGKTATIDS